jgi:hypothetical protein
VKTALKFFSPIFQYLKITRHLKRSLLEKAIHLLVTYTFIAIRVADAATIWDGTYFLVQTDGDFATVSIDSRKGIRNDVTGAVTPVAKLPFLTTTPSSSVPALPTLQMSLTPSIWQSTNSSNNKVPSICENWQQNGPPKGLAVYSMHIRRKPTPSILSGQMETCLMAFLSVTQKMAPFPSFLP